MPASKWQEEVGSCLLTWCAIRREPVGRRSWAFKTSFLNIRAYGCTHKNSEPALEGSIGDSIQKKRKIKLQIRPCLTFCFSRVIKQQRDATHHINLQICEGTFHRHLPQAGLLPSVALIKSVQSGGCRCFWLHKPQNPLIITALSTWLQQF